MTYTHTHTHTHIANFHRQWWQCRSWPKLFMVHCFLIACFVFGFFFFACITPSGRFRNDNHNDVWRWLRRQRTFKRPRASATRAILQATKKTKKKKNICLDKKNRISRVKKKHNWIEKKNWTTIVSRNNWINFIKHSPKPATHMDI